MVGQTGWLEERLEGDSLTVSAGGDWRVATLAEVDPRIREAGARPARAARIDLSAVEMMDTAGAWAIYRTVRDWRARGVSVEFVGAKPIHASMLERIAASDREQNLVRDEPHPVMAMIERTGRAMHLMCQEAAALLSFLGATVVTLLRVLVRPGRIRFVSLVSHIERVGLNAMPIVGLLSFLIGVVLAYQGADQLRQFGAEIFTVNLLGVAILREMGILLTAIIIAGRSGSAFTAQIGTMQVNQEVDAMRTLGLDPIEVLVLPRVMALLIALPLLTVFADLAGIAGGLVMSMVMLDISFVQFVQRFQTSIGLSTFWVGIIKAPVFGFIIALVGCREGMAVSGSAESVGRQTTRSVVIAIFLVIVFDAFFSILFSYLGI